MEESIGRASAASKRDERRVRVWDPFVRIFHWSVAVAFFVAYFTGDEALALHVWSGYLVGGLVVLRIVWGFIGPRHARFSDFVTSPWRAFAYLKDLLAGRAPRHLGHSPAGGMMVVLLLTALLATVWSGLELYATEENAGPLAQAAASPSGGDPDPAPRASHPGTLLSVVFPPAWADEEEDEEGRAHEREKEESFAGELWEEAHELLANLTFALVVLHVLGVLLASAVHRENLIRAMVTGWKRAE